MIRSTQFTDLHRIEKDIISIANEFGRTIPEIRFFSLDSEEFMSLLEKDVYPASPASIWEGKNVIKRRFKSDTGRETGIYYEVVQTGNPSYAYLNENNSLTTQASVMAHVVGHCEFSELNVLKDSDDFRSERIIYLVSRIENSIRSMGFKNYTKFRNACESLSNLALPQSQYSLANSIETDSPMPRSPKTEEEGGDGKKIFESYSYTLQNILQPVKIEEIVEKDELGKLKNEIIDRRGYRLRAPCQDILGFLAYYSPSSSNERNILEYMYAKNKHHQFVIQTQIMNEGWATYWEHKIMMEAFKKKVVPDIIDYCRVFSGVCMPRPFFMRNPYHLGYNMWKHIEGLFSKGKVCLDYVEEKDRMTKENWDRSEGVDPIKSMEGLVRTVTDCEFLRRFLSHELIEELHLNRIPYQMYIMMNIDDEMVKKSNDNYVWLYEEPVKQSMLNFFVDFGRPSIYVIDCDYKDGGLLLFHRHKGKNLKEEWIGGTLKNVNRIWKAPVYILTDTTMYWFSDNKLYEETVGRVEFDEVRDRLAEDKKPVES